MDVRQSIKCRLSDLLSKEYQFNINEDEIFLECPADPKNGDLSTNISLTKFKDINVNNKYNSPFELAQSITEKYNIKVSDDINKIEAVKPGFINLYLSDSYYKRELDKILTEKENYGSGKLKEPKRVLIDYSSPNIAKRFSIGHLRSTIIGQALYNMYKYLGWETVGDSHLGDWGTQFGILIYAIEDKDLDVSKLNINEFEDLYVEYSAKIHDNPDLRKNATDAFVRLEKGEEKARKIWKTAIEISLKEYEKIYSLLGVKIDHAYGESFYEEIMKDIIDISKNKGLTEKSEGASIIRFDDLPPAILIKSDGATTYLTRDLATIKFRRENPELKSDLYIYEVGADQTLHFKQVFKTAEMLGYGKMSDYVHIPHGMIRLPEGKMSTRKGNTIKLEEVLTKSIQKAKQSIKNPEILNDPEKIERLAVSVGIGAIKYNDLKYSPTTNYIFSWEEALNMNGNSGPYIQYTIARIKSLLRKVDTDGKRKIDNDLLEDVDKNEFEKKILLLLSKFEQEIENSAYRYAPNLLAGYLFDLASAYNNFYNNVNVLKTQVQEVQDFRLNLSAATQIVLTNGLRLLGIESPEEM